MKKSWKIACLVLPGCGLLYLLDQYHITAEEILSWQPENLALAGVILMVGYAVKSTLVFVPIMLLQILAGHIYGRETAVFVNLLGLAVVMSVPYGIGKKLGAEKMEQLLRKYPKVQSILKVQEDNEMALCFMLRACAVPPADIVTMYLGATGMKFSANVIGGVLGCFPGMVLTTILGSSIRDPESPAFWQALTLNALWIILSGLGFWLLRKRPAAKKDADNL